MGRKKRVVDGETAPPKKECQRGPGVAALERMRLEKQMRSLQHRVEPTIESVQSHLNHLNAIRMGDGSTTSDDCSQVPNRWNNHVALTMIRPTAIKLTAVKQPLILDTELSLKPPVDSSNQFAGNSIRNEGEIGSSNLKDSEELDLELRL